MEDLRWIDSFIGNLKSFKLICPQSSIYNPGMIIKFSDPGSLFFKKKAIYWFLFYTGNLNNPQIN
jgi:hypothetical protein